ncbi:hypothetical protein BDZ97DRAFT_1752120 [Flammula alnicola]|nr:hypothetical protein BDZ97DRAFT_1752120 [Flammula alnicola]
MSPLLSNWTTGNEPLTLPFARQTLPQVLKLSIAAQRLVVAALTFLVWDIILLLMMKRTWSYTKYVYFIVRYLPVLVQISILLIGSELTPHFHFTPHDCFIWQVYQGVAAAIIVTTVDTILILRVHALYHGHHVIRRLVAVFFLFEIAGMAVGLALAVPGVTYDNICLVVSVPPTLIIYGPRSGWGDVPLIVLIMRDGTWAFFLLFCVYVGQIGLYGLRNAAFAGVLYGWLLTCFSFSGYRILLNLSRLRNVPTANRAENTHTQESFELSSNFTSPRSGGRTFDTSQISTLSLGK